MPANVESVNPLHRPSVVEIRDNGIDLPSVGKCSRFRSRLPFPPFGVL